MNDADATQLWRVFSNLISNALKHNPPGITGSSIFSMLSGAGEAEGAGGEEE